MEKKEPPPQIPPVTPVAQKSWWGSWAASTEADESLSAPEDVIVAIKSNSNSDVRSSTSETMKPRMSEDSVPADTMTFLDWYNAHSQR